MGKLSGKMPITAQLDVRELGTITQKLVELGIANTVSEVVRCCVSLAVNQLCDKKLSVEQSVIVLEGINYVKMKSGEAKARKLHSLVQQERAQQERERLSQGAQSAQLGQSGQSEQSLQSGQLGQPERLRELGQQANRARLRDLSREIEVRGEPTGESIEERAKRKYYQQQQQGEHSSQSNSRGKQSKLGLQKSGDTSDKALEEMDNYRPPILGE